MIIELFAQYLESVVAFWRGVVRIGLLDLLLIGLLVWWFCSRRRCCRCRICGCRCGRCRCCGADEADEVGEEA